MEHRNTGGYNYVVFGPDSFNNVNSPIIFPVIRIDTKMRILLIAMPDTVSALDAVMRLPNLGLCSIAGNLKGHTVKVVDLVFHNRDIRRYLQRILSDFQPEIVGLSAMSYQYASACRAAQVCREVQSEVKVVLGGYHATLMDDEIGTGTNSELFDFIVRGEGEKTFQHLVDEVGSSGSNFSGVAGLSYKKEGRFIHNPDASLLELDTLELPDRDCRLLDRSQFLGQTLDCVETSRGCTAGCHFCSINMMYGQTVRVFSLDRVIKDLQHLRERGKQGVFFVDDNITLNVPRLKNLCEFIVQEKLNTLTYSIQASVQGVASDPGLAKYLKAAGFKWVFLGIESGIQRNLEFMGKKRVLENTQRAVALLKDQGIGVFGGFIVGHPEDTRQDISATFRFALHTGVDHPIIQCLTPYPKTKTREELHAQSLITNKEDFSLYNGFTCNVRTRHLDNRQLNRAIFLNGLFLYFNPRYLISSRFWNFRLSLIPALIANNLRYLTGALRGRIFASRHRW
jgi:anaerobic magnesium-protoporphyrin IX monomethyl ester cyclase